MSKPQEDVARVWQADEWRGVPIAALLEAIRRVRGRGDEVPVADLPAFARRFAQCRLLDRRRRRRRKRRDEHAATGDHAPAQIRADPEQDSEQATASDAIAWFFTTLDRLERDELPRDIIVPTRKGPARLRLQDPVNVAKTLRGLYVESRDGGEIAAMLQVSEIQVSKYKTAGLRYLQLLAAKELP